MEHLIGLRVSRNWNPVSDYTGQTEVNRVENISYTQPVKTHKCMTCGRSYSRRQGLFNHVKWECGKEPTFQCPFCPQRCKRRAHQIRHIRRQHSDMIQHLDPKDHTGVLDVMNE